MSVQELYESISADYKNTIYRFMGNQLLLEKFVKKFPADVTFEKLELGINQKDCETIRKESHTLKGISANLGFTELCDRCTELTVSAREKEPDMEKIILLFAQTKEKYQDIVVLIGKLE